MMRYFLYILIIIYSISINVNAEDNKPIKDISKKFLEMNNDDIIVGNPQAKITMIEYSSLSCPHCAYFHKKVWEDLKKKYIDSGKLKYSHRDYPLDLVALKGSTLAHCAGKDKYYIFLKILFEKQENWVMDKNYLEILENIGKLGGISSDQFNKCMNDKALEDSIVNSRLIATNELNVNGTPSFFINGENYTGMHNLEFFSKIIDKIIKTQNL